MKKINQNENKVTLSQMLPYLELIAKFNGLSLKKLNDFKKAIVIYKIQMN